MKVHVIGVAFKRIVAYLRMLLRNQQSSGIWRNGRRNGLKIRFRASGVRVQLPLSPRHPYVLLVINPRSSNLDLRIV